MGFFEVLGDAAKAVGGAIEDAADWVGDRATDVGNWFGDLYHGNLGDQAIPAPELVAKILASQGAQSWHQGAGQAADLAAKHAETGARVQQLSAGLESAWTGGGADAAQSRIKPFAEVTTAAAATYTGNGQNLTDLAHGFDSLKQSLQPIPGAPPHKNLWDEATWWNTDTEDQINQYNKVVKDNLDRYHGYTQHAQTSGQGLKTDYGQLSGFDGDVTLSQPGTDTASTRDTAGAPEQSGPGSRYQAGTASDGGPSAAFGPGHTGGGAPVPGSSGHLYPAASHPAAYPPAGHQAGVGTGRGDGTTVSGWTPPEYSRTGGPGSGWVPSSSIPGGGGNNSGNSGGNSWSPGLVGGFGPTGGGASEPGVGGSGRGGNVAGRLGAGAGVGAGENAPGVGTGARGPAGARGGSGMGGMGAVGGGKGKGEEDKEHQRKYGLEDDSAFDLTDDEDGRLRDPRTGLPPTPPTIGG
ncbi:hypothetical protein [Amycolatopsis sp. GA6-003]|uniref:hypothetical protein n=1 Tax=Amycolatopsis sp. GA6-003 TaxID=2652444 RepID=UPI0039175DCC